MFLGKNLLVIGAHPDDIEYGVFGTLCRVKESNFNVICYIATHGGENDSTSGSIRIKESRDALSLIPIDYFEDRNRVGLSFESYANIVQDLETTIHTYNIDTIIVPSSNDTHQDHRLICDITLSSVRRKRISILFYNTLSSLDFKTNLYVDITPWFELKKKALKCMITQNCKSWMDDSYLQVFNSDNYTSLLGIKYVEKFEVKQFFW